jgi:hypothetical protein
MKSSKANSTRARGTGRAAQATAVQDYAGAASTKQPKVAIPVRIKTLRTVSGKTGPMTKLIERYGAAFEKSKLTGGPVSFKVDVNPKGVPTFTPLEGRSAAFKAPLQASERSDDLDQALASARERGRVRVADILSGEDMLSADEFAELLGTSRVTVNAKRQNHQVLGLEGAKRGFRFPDWQIGEDGKPFEALPELFDRLGDNPWAVYRFLVQHHPELDGLTGREAIKRGRTAEVVEAAESVARAFA